MKVVTRLPNEFLPQEYFDVRYEILRKPLGSPKGSEQLARDNEAINVWAEFEGKIASIGRAHPLKDDEDGSVIDVEANSACPAFGPLGKDFDLIDDDNGVQISGELRPAIQVRAMGTLAEFQGQGLASQVLAACVENSISHWGAKTGWLQARVAAIPFYERNGWVCFGPRYNIPNVGPHRSMWKKFENLS